MIQCFDDFLPKDDFLKIQKVFTSTRFHWRRAGILHDKDNPRVEAYGEPPFMSDDLFNIHFVNTVYLKERGVINRDLIFGPLAPLFQKLEINQKNLLRCKVNLNPYQGKKHVFSGWHTDYQYPNARTAILYVNTNNGYTAYKDGSRSHIVRSKANRLFTFPALTSHAGVTQTDSQYRIVININWIPD